MTLKFFIRNVSTILTDSQRFTSSQRLPKCSILQNAQDGIIVIHEMNNIILVRGKGSSNMCERIFRVFFNVIVAPTNLGPVHKSRVSARCDQLLDLDFRSSGDFERESLRPRLFRTGE